jgi:hypothetical protein
LRAIAAGDQPWIERGSEEMKMGEKKIWRSPAGFNAAGFPFADFLATLAALGCFLPPIAARRRKRTAKRGIPTTVLLPPYSIPAAILLLPYCRPARLLPLQIPKKTGEFAMFWKVR